MIVELDGREVSLTEEQVEAFGKLTKLQQSVALAKLSNGDIVEAHRNAGGKSNNEKYRSDLALQILSNPRTASFIDSFKSLDGSRIAAMVLSRDELLLDLTDIARTTLDDVVSFSERPLIDMENGMEVLSSTIHIRSIDEISPGARKAIKSVKQTKHGLEVTMYDGLAARKQISEMCGYDAPIKTELSGKIQTQEIPDEEIEQKLKTLGLGRYHNQLGEKIVTK
tara:strand:+ start:11268 stop:11939 length:672 start_codon:yes stop_codon:yes gene_type:complete